MTVPLLIVGGGEARAEAADDLTLRGWMVRVGWDVPTPPLATVCSGPVDSAVEMSRVVLAAVSGAGVLAEVGARSLAEQLGDDLRRLGHVEHRFPDHGWSVLDREERRLLDLLGDGVSLGEAAQRLHVGRRTADRRLASARARLGASSNSAAIAIRRQRLSSIPRRTPSTV
jgi:DNA-binding CsgD family transcriptional regulator